MNPTTRQLSAAAGLLKCQFSFEPQSPNSRTAKVRAVARTADAIEVFGWSSDLNPNGRIVHDLSGFNLRKQSIPMLFNHGANVIGEWNRFEVRDGQLIVSGILKSTEPGDLASSLMGKLREDLPFEASINFGDELTAEEYPPGESFSCNGQVYQGPATVIRRWFLREVSLCPLGADPSTSAALEADTPAEAAPEPAFTFTATIRPRTQLSATPAPKEAPPDAMLNRPDAGVPKSGSVVCGEAPVPTNDAAVADTINSDAADEPALPPEAETPSVAEDAIVVLPESSVVDDAPAQVGSGAPALADPPVQQEITPESRDAMVIRLSAEFGAEKAVQWLLSENLSEDEARRRHCRDLAEQLTQVRKELADVRQSLTQTPGRPVFIPSDDPAQQREAAIQQQMARGASRGQAEFIVRNQKP